MRLLGRLLLLAVGGVLIYLSISSIISNYNAIQTIGWDNFFSQDMWNAVSSILIQAFYVLCGLYSVFVGLRGKSSFISFVAAAVLIAIVVVKTINFVNSGQEKTFETIFNLVLSFLMPIGFSLGVIILTIGRSEKKQSY